MPLHARTALVLRPARITRVAAIATACAAAGVATVVIAGDEPVSQVPTPPNWQRLSYRRCSARQGP